MAGKWSAEETALLKELLTAHTVREARQKLGRSEYAVRKQMRKLKDSKDPVKYEDMNREDGENIRRMYKRAENKVERLKILKDLYPSYTKETILAAALHNPFRERDKLYEQITKEQNEVKKVIGRYDEETKAAAVKDVLLNGMTQAEAAEKYGVNAKSVGYWCSQAKKKQRQYMDYAEKTEKELTVAKETGAEKTFNPEYKPRPEPIFKPVEERINEMGYDDPERIALVAELAEAESVCADEDSKPAVDEKVIKAAAFDVITNQMSEYPCSSTDTMMRFIQGVQALAVQLCEEQ